ncbi:MAG: hypothetical protein V4553_18030 [Bacteroidota bacterium]
MKEKIDFYSSVLFTALFCLLLLDVALWVVGIIHRIPGSHKEVLLTGFLLWFVILVARRDRDDDWAGQV